MNSSSVVKEAAEGLGLLFYLIDPTTTSYSDIELCPDYVGQAIPYMVFLILMEGFVNHFLRGKKQNLADSVTSISSGMLMTLGGLLTRFAMISTYNYIHLHHHIVVLPWHSSFTWLLTAILLDLGYYCFHRASHEVGLLWAVHQVHHSSQEFNLTTAFRQPVLEGVGWLTHWFYLPMAFFIPTPQMLVHSEFNFLYQFLLHTELLGDLGPLGYLLNTASHHRVHHGANRYCLDKNYGGWLSVWDRIFGTFQEEIPEEDIVYGLVDQPRFFDVIKHQLFYFEILQEKARTTGDWFKSWFCGPGWFPGLPRLGDNDLVEEKPVRPIHVSEVSALNHINIILQLLSVVIVHDDIFHQFPHLSCSSLLVLVIFFVWTAYSIGLQYDQSYYSFLVETARCLTFSLFLLSTSVASSSPSSFLIISMITSVLVNTNNTPNKHLLNKQQ